MKIRNSFVTNSSSSSFILIGVNADNYFEKFGAEKYKSCGENYYELKDDTFEIVKTEYYYYISLFEAYIRKSLYDKTVNQLKLEFVENSRNKGIEVSPDDVCFEYGGYYNG